MNKGFLGPSPARVIRVIAVFLAIACTGCDGGRDAADNGVFGLIQPGDLTYLGAFRLPETDTGDEVASWAYGGQALTYRYSGDASGPDDGFPGSLIGCGHAWEHRVSEVTIPVPVVSTGKDVDDLPSAITLQAFTDILRVSDLEIPRAGLGFLAHSNVERLYFCYGAHFQNGGEGTHGCCGLDFSTPNMRRGWFVDCPHNVYNTNDYMFEIPADWADRHIPGMRLVSGRFRDGGWSGQGPSLVALEPWGIVDLPPGSALTHVTLLMYASSEDEGGGSGVMDLYHHSDEWSGGVWLSTSDKGAVVFVGTKGIGDCWYGDRDGPCLECAGERGWWSSGFEGWFLFYDPADLAEVAAGRMAPGEPQPYAHLWVDEFLYHVESTQQKAHLGAASFDPERGLLYVLEPLADANKPLVHVWRIGG